MLMIEDGHTVKQETNTTTNQSMQMKPNLNLNSNLEIWRELFSAVYETKFQSAEQMYAFPKQFKNQVAWQNRKE